MKIAEINMLTSGSTGKIMFQIAETARNQGCKVNTYSPVAFVRGKKNKLISYKDHFWWGNRFESCAHYYLGVLFGVNGLLSINGTRQLIGELKKFAPDVIHLHNLHGFCVNIPMLFNYIKKNNIKVVWTLHDCWAFTGHCPHFTMAKCDKWKTGCYKCPQYKEYPKSLFDNSKKMYRLKKKWFTGVENLTIVTPSEWLAGLVKQSFLKDYPVKVINNGIDLSLFKPTESDFRNKYNISEGKFILLGVAFGWGKRKGLDVFIELGKRLDGAKYQIVLVGTDDNVDKQLSCNIISIHRTQNQIELAEIYTAADLFVNPTREENYPTVNMESIACGTPVITFSTGGSPEILTKKTGMIVDCDDIDGLQHGIEKICEQNLFSTADCIEQAKQFDMNEKFKEYLKLYEDRAYYAQRSI